MSEFSSVISVVGIVAIVAIVFGFVFRARIEQSGIEIEAEPPTMPKKKRAKRKRRKIDPRQENSEPTVRRSSGQDAAR